MRAGHESALENLWRRLYSVNAQTKRAASRGPSINGLRSRYCCGVSPSTDILMWTTTSVCSATAME